MFISHNSYYVKILLLLLFIFLNHLFMDKLLTFWFSPDGFSYKKAGELVIDDSFYSADIKISISNKSDNK